MGAGRVRAAADFATVAPQRPTRAADLLVYPVLTGDRQTMADLVLDALGPLGPLEPPAAAHRFFWTP